MTQTTVAKATWILALGATLACVLECAPSAPRGERRAAPAPDRIWDPDLACDLDGRAYAVALTRTAAGDAAFVFATAPGGQQWTVSDPAPFGQAPRGRRCPRLAVGRPGEVFCAWEDSRSGAVDLYFNRSLDAGTTWIAEDLRLNTNGPGLSHLAVPAIACDDIGRVYAVWRDDREGFDAYYCNASSDRGTTWRPRDVRINNIGFGRKHEPRIACDRRGGLFVAWIENRNGTQGAFFNASYDAGETWLPSDLSLGDGGGVFALELATAGDGTLVAVWAEATVGGRRILAASSTSDGRFWQPPQRLSTSDLRGDSSAPLLVSDGRRNLYAAWTATGADGIQRIAVASTTNGGVRWNHTPVRLETPIVEVDPYSVHRGLVASFDMACDTSGNVYLTWIAPVAGIPQVTVDRIGGFGSQWMRLSPPFELSAYAPTTLVTPMIACDDFGRVYLLWNGGHALHTAVSPFYGESGWRHHAF